MTDTWRFIDTGACSASCNMALDEAIADNVRRNYEPPTLRLYGWNIPSVSIGCFQKIRDLDIDYCTDKNIAVVRRPTGGRAVLHGNEVTYSFSVKTTSGLFSKGLLDSYKKIGAALALALLKIGISPESKSFVETRRRSDSVRRSKSPLCFKSISYGEISSGSKKIIGSAQKRWTDGLLQQGSIPLIVDKNTLPKIFSHSSIQDTGESFVGLKEIFPELNTCKLKDAVRSSFEETFNIKFTISPPSKEEISLAQNLEVQKYLSDEWNFKR